MRLALALPLPFVAACSSVDGSGTNVGGEPRDANVTGTGGSGGGSGGSGEVSVDAGSWDEPSVDVGGMGGSVVDATVESGSGHADASSVRDAGAPPDSSNWSTPVPPPPKGGSLVIDGLTGELTQHEVDGFIGATSAMSIPTSEHPNGSHNELADGAGGMTLEAINLVCEATLDAPALHNEHVWLLDLAIAWSDAWLLHRNDLPLGDGRVMWTGKVDPIWPPNPPNSTYAGSEVGETVGILAFTALNILNTRGIENVTVPDGDPNHYGATYLDRAKTYVSMLDFTMDKFFDAYFLDPVQLTIRHPQNSPGYETYSANNVNAWNREMMFLHAWQTLGQAHEILGDDPSRAAKYKTITIHTVDEFVKNAVPYKASDGTPVYDWGYGNFGDVIGKLKGEDTGIHAQWDIWGLTRAYRAGYTTATPDQMKTYGDTIVHALRLGAQSYAATIDGTTKKYAYLPPGFMYLAPYSPDVYKDGANDDISSGQQKSNAAVTASILWVKHYFATHP
jgi:hypothetical protein